MAKKADQHSEEKTATENPKLDDCFIITPIGEVNSDVWNKTKGLIASVVEPVLAKFNFIAVPAHYIATPGSIPKQIIRHIVEDKLVIANLTGLNPNVMYELAVRHAVKLPLVTLAEKGTKLPFDIVDQRTIFYEDTFNGVEDCKIALAEAIEMALRPDATVENPIYDAIQAKNIIQSTDPESANEYFMQRLDRIEDLISQTRFNDFYPRVEQSAAVKGSCKFTVVGHMDTIAIDEFMLKNAGRQNIKRWSVSLVSENVVVVDIPLISDVAYESTLQLFKRRFGSKVDGAFSFDF
ncbi:hypothetical protein [Hufsiella ginkgonis]|uniref:Uncharacterized protein n=1 Tax=Hufsiella ginkgonis TaxID=2695274 RepID=A0A7K1Y0T7_9SPHI|nr:hypothetical protein [Hufsiella ginkgonis]MXV16841.1 hypothetical protein [Hufsiella ginkgonis]